MQMFHPKVKRFRFPLVTSLDGMSESNVFGLTLYYRSASEDSISWSQGHLQTESSDADPELCGTIVAHLIPDQEVVCSTHVGVKSYSA